VALFDERCQVESLSAAVRQLELERNEVQSQLHESQALSQALRDKLENIQHDLASQGSLLDLPFDIRACDSVNVF